MPALPARFLDCVAYLLRWWSARSPAVRKILASSFVVGVLVAVAGSIANVWFDDSVKTTPKLGGSLLISSFGQSGYSGRSSILVLAYLASAREVPVVPMGYQIQILYGGVWHPARAVLTPQQRELSLAIQGDDAALFGRQGSWTACFPMDKYLLNAPLVGAPVTRDKPVLGLIQFETDLTLAQLSRRQGLRVVVRAADHVEYVIDEKRDLYVNSTLQHLQPRWLPGSVSCDSDAKSHGQRGT
jgi:hypothetical protein